MDAAQFKKNLERITDDIRETCAKISRDPLQCRIMAVTKTHPREYVETAIACHHTLFGENRVKEAEEKYKNLLPQCELHLIGHLQRNKAHTAARLFSCVQSIDKIETAVALNDSCEKLDKHLDVLIEVNTSGEPGKFGVTGKDNYFELLESVSVLKYITFRGLMTVGPLSTDETRIRNSFSMLRNFFEETRLHYPDLRCDVLSMGMSSDLIIALEEGATIVRIGTALFGTRA